MKDTKTIKEIWAQLAREEDAEILAREEQEKLEKEKRVKVSKCEYKRHRGYSNLVAVECLHPDRPRNMFGGRRPCIGVKCPVI